MEFPYKLDWPLQARKNEGMSNIIKKKKQKKIGNVNEIKITILIIVYIYINI